MRLLLTIISGILLLVFHPEPVYAQDMEPVSRHDLYDSISLPPLSVLIDSALANNPSLMYYQQGVSAKKLQMEMDKKSWTRNFGVQADVRYGTFDNFSTNTAEGQNPTLIATRASQTNYGLGGYFKLPLSDFVTRKTQFKLAKMQIDQAECLAQVQRDEIRQAVIKQYNDVMLKLTLLKIKAEILETSRINMVMAEKEFQNGIIPLGTYSGLAQTASTTEINFEEAKVDFKTAFMILEEIVGFKFGFNVQ